jgi:DNA-binding transcriptional LysR family regulator
LYRRFVRGELDAAVILMPREWAPDAPCEIADLRAERLVLIAPRAAGQPDEVAFDPRQHGHHQWILNPDGCGFRGALQRQLEAVGHPLRVQFELDAAPNEHLAMVAAGLGSSIVPESTLVEFPEPARLVQRLQTDNPDFNLRVMLVWSRHAAVPEAVRDGVARLFTGKLAEDARRA